MATTTLGRSDLKTHFSNRGIYWAIAIIVVAALAITYFVTRNRYNTIAPANTLMSDTLPAVNPTNPVNPDRTNTYPGPVPETGRTPGESPSIQR